MRWYKGWPKENDVLKNLLKDILKKLTNRQRLVLEVLAADASLSAKAISEKGSVSERRIESDLAQLKKIGILSLDEVQSMNSSNELKNTQMNLEQFMATCKIECEALTAQFILSTFSAWFDNTEVSSLMKNSRATCGKLNIEIKVDIE